MTTLSRPAGRPAPERSCARRSADKRRRRGRLDHHRVAGRERRPHFVRGYRQRIIERRDRRDDADRERGSSSRRDSRTRRGCRTAGSRPRSAAPPRPRAGECWRRAAARAALHESSCCPRARWSSAYVSCCASTAIGRAHQHLVARVRGKLRRERRLGRGRRGRHICRAAARRPSRPARWSNGFLTSMRVRAPETHRPPMSS